MVYSAIYRAGQLARRAYTYYRPTIRGDSFVSKFPPNYRNDIRTILKGSEIAFGGGLISDIAKDFLYDDGGVGDDAQIPSERLRQRSQFSKTRYRRKRCSCRRNTKYNRPYRRR